MYHDSYALDSSSRLKKDQASGDLALGQGNSRSTSDLFGIGFVKKIAVTNVEQEASRRNVSKGKSPRKNDTIIGPISVIASSSKKVSLNKTMSVFNSRKAVGVGNNTNDYGVQTMDRG